MAGVLDHDYGPTWAWLQERGWEIVPTTVPVGTARSNWHTRKIEMLPRAFHRPVTRVVRYVLPHEMAKAVHYEVSFFECENLRINRRISWRSAIEVVAGAYLLHETPSTSMRSMVRASTLWSGHAGVLYGMSDIDSREASDVVVGLHDRVRETS